MIPKSGHRFSDQIMLRQMHDPETWSPVFGPDHASTKSLIALGRVPLAPQPGGGNVGALPQCFELGPHDVLGHPFPADECAKTAVDAGDDPLTIADGGDHGLDALRDH